MLTGDEVVVKVQRPGIRSSSRITSASRSSSFAYFEIGASGSSLTSLPARMGSSGSISVSFIHQVLYDEYLSKHDAPEDCEYYLCGPPMMNTAVIKMLENLGVPKENILLDDFGG